MICKTHLIFMAIFTRKKNKCQQLLYRMVHSSLTYTLLKYYMVFRMEVLYITLKVFFKEGSFEIMEVVKWIFGEMFCWFGKL